MLNTSRLDEHSHSHRAQVSRGSVTGSEDAGGTIRASTRQQSESSVSRLKAFLSGQDLDNRSEVHSGQAIRSLYLSAKARSQLGELEASEMSGLISLFGTLSTPQSARGFCGRFLYQLPTQLEDDQPGRSFWPYVVQLVGDKKRQFGRLAQSDHFWIMHARLAEASNATSEPRYSGYWYSHLSPQHQDLPKSWTMPLRVQERTTCACGAPTRTQPFLSHTSSLYSRIPTRVISPKRQGALPRLLRATSLVSSTICCGR